MTILIVALLLLALIFGGLGLLVEGLFWLLVIAFVLFLAGIIAGVLGRSRRA